MAKLKLMLDPRNKKREKKPLVIRVSHRDSREYIQLGPVLTSQMWNETQVSPKYPNSVKMNARIMKKFSLASDVLSDHNSVIKKLKIHEIVHLINLSLEENDNKKGNLKETIIDTSKQTTLKDYGALVVAKTRRTKTNRYADSEEAAIKHLLKFHGNDKLLISEINLLFLENFEAHYIKNCQKDDSLNGLALYLRSIRKIMNVAIKDPTTEVTMQHYSFGNHGYSIRKSSTEKRAIDLKDIKKIIDFEAKEFSSAWHHKNYFTFYFYMRGMNFVDVAFLKMNKIRNGRLVYKRRKTKHAKDSKLFNIEIPIKIKKILAYYTEGKSPNDFVFPIMEKYLHVKDQEIIDKAYHGKLKYHNKSINKIAKAVGLETKVTTYVARHSFATAALHNGVSKAEIGDMLGHADYNVTETYMKDLLPERLDQAANKVFDLTDKEEKVKKKK